MAANEDQTQHPPCLHCAIAEAIRAYAEAGHPICLGQTIQALASVLADIIDIHSDDITMRRAAYKHAITLLQESQPHAAGAQPKRPTLHLVPPAGNA